MPEAINRSDETPRQVDAVRPNFEPVVDPRKDEQVRRERELENVS
jgi:hypothetical protein